MKDPVIYVITLQLHIAVQDIDFSINISIGTKIWLIPNWS